MGRPVTIWSHTRARGSGNFSIKNGAIWSNLVVPKYVITNLKINDSKDNKSTTAKLRYHIFLFDQSRCAWTVLLSTRKMCFDREKEKQ